MGGGGGGGGGGIGMCLAISTYNYMHSYCNKPSVRMEPYNTCSTIPGGGGVSTYNRVTV